MAALAAFLALLTLWRLAGLALSPTDLFVDEAQYWFWSRDLAFGYFSKPPLIAWAIRASTEIGGDASAFWVRAPAPLLAAAASLLVAGAAARLWGPRVGALSGAAFATLPGVSFGSLVIATDIVALPFVAGALWLWLRLVDRPGDRDAILFGLCLGFGALAKYAMLYVALCAALAALARPGWRLPRRSVLLAFGACLAALAPNLVWNLANGLATVAHTAHNATGHGRGLDPSAMIAFVGAQFGVMGPILFAAWLAALARPPAGAQRALLWFSAPILALVSAQALRAGANANWAAPAFVAATPLAVAYLAARAPRLLGASFALHLAVAVLLPLASAFPASMPIAESRSPFARVLGRAELARAIGDAAAAQGLGAVVSDNRGLTADLLHALRDRPITVYAARPLGAPGNHFELAIPAPAAPDRDMLFATLGGAPPVGWPAAEPVAARLPEAPFLKGRPVALWRLRGAP
jgi:4-amino-4-deoxy-L-arabinose transferase-like glycosyltransferase